MTKEAVNLSHAYKAIAAFFKRYENLSDPGYMLKIRHTYLVAANARRIAEALNLSETDVKLAELIGLLHDVGKSKIPNEILNKPARLTDEEFLMMKHNI